MTRIRVLITDDHTLFRSGLRLLLSNEPDIAVVGEAGDGAEAIRLARTLRPDVVLMDITMPGMSGLDATRAIRQDLPEVRVLILTMHEDEGYLRESLRAGASGYVLKRAAAAELAAAIRAAWRGETFIYPSLTRALVRAYLEAVGRMPPEQVVRAAFDGLTERELTVLQLLALGYTNQEVADLLVLSVKTVETHRARIMDKLGLKSRADLVRYAIRKGLLESDQAISPSE
jgi:two-component system response regulator NreC